MTLGWDGLLTQPRPHRHQGRPCLRSRGNWSGTRLRRRALADARSIDDVKHIQDKAVAVEAYAKQAKDGELIGLATEIRKRAERRLGELMAELSSNGLMAKGAREKGTDRGSTRAVGGPASLSSHGIDKHLADRARKAAAMPEARFEAEVAKAQQIAVASIAGAREGIAAARAEHHKAKQEKRTKREQQWAGKILAFPTKKYGVILADPEWRFEFYSELRKTNSSADNHYQTSSLDEIKKRDLASISAPDCVLFLWATVPMLPRRSRFWRNGGSPTSLTASGARTRPAPAIGSATRTKSCWWARAVRSWPPQRVASSHPLSTRPLESIPPSRRSFTRLSSGTLRTCRKLSSTPGSDATGGTVGVTRRRMRSPNRNAGGLTRSRCWGSCHALGDLDRKSPRRFDYLALSRLPGSRPLSPLARLRCLRTRHYFTVVAQSRPRAVPMANWNPR
jgi:hypothetical protein